MYCYNLVEGMRNMNWIENMNRSLDYKCEIWIPVIEK